MGFRGFNVPEGIDVHFNEYPGNDLLTSALSSITSAKGVQGALLSMLEEFGASFLVSKTIHYTINPRVHGFLITDDEIKTDALKD